MFTGKFTFFLFFFLHTQVLPSYGQNESSEWSYADVNSWPDSYPSCRGMHQSPIDINMIAPPIMGNEYLEHVVFSGFEETPSNMTMVNNGHTVVITAGFDGNRFPSCFFLGSNYVFGQMDFHWGPDNDEGSEHTIQKHGFPLGLQLMHYNLKYGSLEEALNWTDGIVMIAFLFAKDSSIPVLAFDNISNGLKKVTEPGSETEIKPFPLTDFGIQISQGYILYPGSLTSPPCTEDIWWIIPNSIQAVSKKVLDLFRKVKLSNGDDHNNRPVQPLNDRMIEYHTLQWVGL